MARTGRPKTPRDIVEELYLSLLRLGKTEIEINAVPEMPSWDSRYRWSGQQIQHNVGMHGRPLGFDDPIEDHRKLFVQTRCRPAMF